MKNLVRVFAFVYIIYAVNCRPHTQTEDEDYDVNVAEPEPGIQNDYEYGEQEGEEDIEPDLPDPILITRPQDFIAKENETVQLPCQLENAGPLVSIWKKNNAIIFQDAIKFDIGNNYRIVNRSLVITDVGANETANYTCFIPLTKNQSLQVSHRLFVQTAPKIVSLKAQNNIMQLDSGKTLVLTCKAIGFPKPTIKWSRKGQRLGTEGETVTIENLSHHDAGDYQCLADNNIEPPAHEFIHIGITHKPIIKIEKVIVNSDNNLDEELVCEVYAVPKPDVVWKRDGLNIKSNERIHFKNHNHTHILQIRRIQKEDLGVYTCSAKNRVGKSERNVTLTVKPSPARHIETKHDHEKNLLIWEVNSKAPITQFVLEYKKSVDSEWKSVAPEVKNADGNIYTVNYTLSHLPGGYYEARVKSENNYGWSDWSDIVSFKSERHHHRHPTLFEQDTPKPDVHEKDVYETHSSDNNNVETEMPTVIHATLAPLGETPQEPQLQNTERKEPVKEQPPPQHQPAKGGNDPDGAASLVPMLSLLCITLFSAIYSR